MPLSFVRTCRQRTALIGFTCLGMLLLMGGNASVARADSLAFDLEDQVAPPGGKDQGRLGKLTLQRGDFTLEISRPGSVFDLGRDIPGNSQHKPDSWGQISLSTFFDYVSSTPLIVDFSRPVSQFSVWMGDFGDDTDNLELEAFSLPGGKGESLGRATKTLKGSGSDFSFENLTIGAGGIRSVRCLAGSPSFPHSMYYDHFVVDTAGAGSGG